MSPEPKGEAKAIEQLHGALEENDLFGKCIFLSSRDHLASDLRKICAEMQAEEQKLTASRGLLMDRTSEIDALVLAYLKQVQIWDQLTDDQATEFFKSAKKRIKDKIRGTKNALAFFQTLAEQDLDALKNCFVDPEKQNELRMMDSSIRNALLKALLCAQPDLKSKGDIHVDYYSNSEGRKSISSYRNDYAHQTEAELEVMHTEELCTLLRVEMRRHLENVRTITTTQ